jgi:hypothetical protein
VPRSPSRKSKGRATELPTLEDVEQWPEVGNSAQPASSRSGEKEVGERTGAPFPHKKGSLAFVIYSVR